MQSAQINKNHNEQKRLEVLNSLGISDSDYDENFKRIVRVTASLFSVPVCAVAIVDDTKVWFKSSIGLEQDQIPRDNSIENEIIRSGETFISNNLLDSDTFNSKLVVSKPPNLKFYAGVPLKIDNKFIGVFFVADRMEREFSQNELNILIDLSYWVMGELLQLREKQVDLSLHQKNEKILQNKNRELEESKAKTEVMLQNIGDGIIGINNAGIITYANKQVDTLLGFKKDEILGSRLINAIKLADENGNEIGPEDRPVRKALLSKQKVVSRDYFFVRKDKSKFPAAITATPVLLFGQEIGGVIVFRDITKEYKIDKMKTEFISLASHQLRTPLSAMKWFSEMLIDGDVGDLNEEQMDVVNNIYQSNERMIELVNTLLNISRIESGRIIIDPKLTDLKELVEEVVTELRPRIKQKKQNLIISVHENLPKINIDPKLVRHVYVNLLTNAIKYTQEGGEIEVLISKSGNEIISQITDNGYGIPKDQQDQVFKKFFRGENIVNKETDGTGLGLYLTYSVVQSSGGKIWFKSKEGEGTTFWFVLPLYGISQKKGEVTLDS